MNFYLHDGKWWAHTERKFKYYRYLLIRVWSTDERVKKWTCVSAPQMASWIIFIDLLFFMRTHPGPAIKKFRGNLAPIIFADHSAFSMGMDIDYHCWLLRGNIWMWIPFLHFIHTCDMLHMQCIVSSVSHLTVTIQCNTFTIPKHYQSLFYPRSHLTLYKKGQL